MPTIDSMSMALDKYLSQMTTDMFRLSQSQSGPFII